MGMPDYEQFFREYAAAYRRSLGETVDSKMIRAFFAEGFVAASTTGKVQAGENDDAFEETLKKGYAFYKAIGTRSMDVERVEAQSLCEAHDKVRVFYRAGYRRPDGKALEIPFDVTYLLQRRQGGPKIFAFVAGDEAALYKQHGLISEGSSPG